MCLQMLWLTEHHKHFMFFQTTWLTEILVTLWAAEWFIFSMNSFMSLPSMKSECVFKCCDWLNIFSHFEQLNGFEFFLCLQMLWLTELLFTLRTAEWFLISMKSFMGLQITWWTEFFSLFEQLNGFSSVWILSCVFKYCDWLNIFLHFEQLNGFSSV